ncbi:helix-turn-helix domain-containing protein [Halalkalibacter okhensis]|uniref:Helicase Helix-turn-helix domain-containing protein n=1 Tax=Halalkalibacter okhensis TaxID=333138 RepID=A0A0B0IL74_9BACI|nr:helix-turn-helix domain-containing protein [Halalkalibacter okhensis]KHF40376.1 hypothetical protein LQ50_10325 [Halalkalibacter okhensis]
METIRQAIVAAIIQVIGAERSIYGIFHLLKGKKSAQTIQDGAFFGVLTFFGLFPALTRELIEEDIRCLINGGYVEKVEKDRVRLTNKGIEKTKNFKMNHAFINDLQGWDYHRYAEQVWLRLALYVQSITNLSVGQNRFFPITHKIEVQDWVKKHLPKEQQKREEISQLVRIELESFLEGCLDVQALIMVLQFSGRKKMGLTKQQIADQLNFDVEKVHVIHLSTMHRLIKKVQQDNQFSYLPHFLSGFNTPFVLTESARVTNDLLEKGHSIDQISQIRKLKRNTIEDHIVEIAIQNPHFSIRPYVPLEVEEWVTTISDTLQTTRLRDLKEKIPFEVDYFVIRLALARKKVKHGA